MEIEIPQRFRRGLSLFLELPDEGMKGFLAALQEAAPSVDRAKFAARVAAQAKVSVQNARTILEVLESLYVVRTRQAPGQQTLEQFVEDVATAVERSGVPRPKTINRERFQEHLAIALRCDASLGVTAKIADLRQEHDHFFCQAR